MPVGLWEPLQMDGRYLLLLGTCEAKVRFMRREGPGKGPGYPRVLHIGRARRFVSRYCHMPTLAGFARALVRPWSQTLGLLS